MALTKVQKEGIETLINNNADNRVITGSSTANTLNAESGVVIDSSGNVGIGTTNPTSTLHLDASGGGVLQLQRTSSNASNKISLSHDGNNGTLDSTNATLFRNGGGERMRIDSAGRVGIGTTSPSQLLEIHGASNPAILLKDTTNNVLSYLYSQDLVGAVGTASDHPFVFNVNNGEKMRITSAGNVGIGTTSPSSKLHVKDAGEILRLETTATTGSNYINFNDADENKAFLGLGSGTDDSFSIALLKNSSLRFATNSTERMRIDSSGKVGINTTSPSHSLEVNGNISLGNGGSSGGSEMLRIHNDSGVQRIDATNNPSALAFGMGGTGSSSERMRIDTSGRVLIGTTTEGTGAADDLTVATTGSTGITVRSGSSNDGSLFFSDGTSGADEYRGFIQYGHASNNMLFGTNGSERMQINSSGNVGIGTTSPATRLEVKNNSSNNFGTSIRLSQGYNSVFSEIGSNFGGSMTLNAGQGTTSAVMHFQVNNSEKMRIDSDSRALFGTNALPSASVAGASIDCDPSDLPVYIKTSSRQHGANAYTHFQFFNTNGAVGQILINGSGTSYVTSSDYRLKENQTAITDGITRLKQLKPYKFNFKADSSTVLDGFFAHEVSSIVPEAVSGEKDAVSTESNVKSGLAENVGDIIPQGLDNAKLVPLLTAALQEEISKREALETRVATLEAT